MAKSGTLTVKTAGNAGDTRDIEALKASVERIELQAREADARLRMYETKTRLKQLKAANSSPEKPA